MYFHNTFPFLFATITGDSGDDCVKKDCAKSEQAADDETPGAL